MKILLKSTLLLAVLAIVLSCSAKPNANNEKVTSEEKVSTNKVEKDDPYKELVWYTDFEEARKLSEAEEKPIFAFFTGSDWCGWCIRLQKNVFAKDDFIKWANEEVILLELDFPRRTELPAELKQQNYELASMLTVRGYPTVWFLTTSYNETTQKVEIAPLGSTGYPSGAEAGKEELKFIADADKILANK